MRCLALGRVLERAVARVEGVDPSRAPLGRIWTATVYAGALGTGGGSCIGARYRHTTPEMATRVIQALDRRLTLALQVAEEITPNRMF